MKSLLAFTLSLFSLSATAHNSPNGAHLSFAEGSYHAHAAWVETPIVGKEALLQINWKDGQTHSPIAAPGSFLVELYMCHGSMCHGSSETVVTQTTDDKGTPIPGAYLVREIFFSMNGPWEVRVEVTFPDGSKEMQSFPITIGGGHGGHGSGHRH